MKNDRQLFVVGDELIQGIDPVEVEATWKDMVEFGIHRPPYKQFDVRITGYLFAAVSKMALDLHEKGLNNVDRSLIELGDNPDEDYQDVLDRIKRRLDDLERGVGRETRMLPVTLSYSIEEDEVTVRSFSSKETPKFDSTQFSTVPSQYFYHSIVVLLATRNVVRTIKESKSARLGIGKKKYVYTTTLSLGKVEAESSGEAGSARGKVRPHLRRGHSKVQRYGPNFAFAKKVFIQPVFVNGHPGAISTRSHYNVRS